MADLPPKKSNATGTLLPCRYVHKHKKGFLDATTDILRKMIFCWNTDDHSRDTSGENHSLLIHVKGDSRSVGLCSLLGE